MLRRFAIKNCASIWKILNGSANWRRKGVAKWRTKEWVGDMGCNQKKNAEKDKGIGNRRMHALKKANRIRQFGELKNYTPSLHSSRLNGLLSLVDVYVCVCVSVFVLLFFPRILLGYTLYAVLAAYYIMIIDFFTTPSTFSPYST